MYSSFLACGSKRVRAWVWKSQLVAALFVLAGPICSGAVSSGKAILSDSIRELPGVVSGPQDPHRPFISRRALSSSESGALMEFEVALKMRNFPELQQRVGRGELISAQEMAAKYNPLPADEQAVADWLKGLGFTLTRRDSNCLAVFARGTVAQIQSALQVDFARVSLEGTEYTSAITAPTVPATIAPLLVGINGLQPHMRAHKHVLKPMSLNNGGAPYLPSQIAAAYSATGLYTSNITGAGQCIAVVIDTLPAKSDLTSFWSTYGVNQSINNISFITVVSGGTGDLTEATLDTEWASSIAPGAQVRVYATSDLSFGNTDKAYQQIITDVENNVPIHQLSLSYGAGEISPVPISTAQINTDSQLFATLAGKGVSVFAASGDGGSTPDGSGGTTGPKQVQYPASDPSVTGVGGTTLQTGYYNAGQIVETGWSLSGGGLSTLARPNWQTGITGMPGGTQRAVPDVACAADPNYGAVLFVNGQPLRLGYGEGGTSWSTPTWAAFCALINQARASAGLGPIGALNSSLYSVYSGANGSSSFRDITSGNNGYAAGTGYDLVTGLGTPVMQNLVHALVPSWQASPESIIYNFSGGADAQSPITGLIQGSDGFFYGTTTGGGPLNDGVVYKISSTGAATIVHTFGDGSVPDDGTRPQSALLLGHDGNLYGTTTTGGASLANSYTGYGTIFEITSQGETILHNFGDGTVPQDGANPQAALVQDSNGNFYGVTNAGGSAGEGTIFKLTPGAAGTASTLTILHNFGDGSVYNEGLGPNGLTLGADGNFYGTTYYGGPFDKGTVFKMTPQGAVTTLHNFGDSGVPNDGTTPEGTLVQGTDGNFYGTTNSGGRAGQGTIFQITPQGMLTIFHNFDDGSVANDGIEPEGPLIQLPNGNFYGTTAGGGSASAGTIFQMTAQGAVTILHSFQDGSVADDGTSPQAGVVHGSDGNFYGTASGGGTVGYGAVFKLTSQMAPSITSPSTATFTTGIAGSFTVAASGSPTPTLSALGVPSGFSFNAATGVLSGTPSTTTGEPFTIVFSASNGVGALAAQTFTLNVQSVASHTAPAITSGAPPGGVVGTAYSFSYQATGAPAPSFSLASGTLPLGLTLSPAGVLSGTPLQSGTFTGSVKASNGVGSGSTQNFSITMQRLPSFISGPPPGNVLVGVPMSFTFLAAGPPSSTFTVTPGSLPTGLSLSSAGVLSGTPTQIGQFSGTVTATNSVGTDTLEFVINVDQAPSFTNGPPPAVAILNTNYSFTFQTGGYPTPTITLTAGSLPPGINLSNGVLTGSPYSAGTYTGTFTASNGVGTPVTENFTIIVGQTPVITSAPPPSIFGLNQSFSFTFASGGNPAPIFSVTSGSLPTGMNLSSDGVLSGTPTQAGTFTVVITASNDVGSSSQTLTFTVAAPGPPQIANGPPPATGALADLYSFAYQSNSYPVPTFSVTSGSLPSGLSLSSAGVISGTPIQAGTFSGIVTADNGLSPAATQAFTITIAQGSISYTIRHNFQAVSGAGDGTNIAGGLVLGPDGNFYGVTQGGGAQYEGMAFQITPQGAETILYAFTGGSDGGMPSGPLIVGPDGAFYGTAQYGGAHGSGVVFRLTSAGSESVIYSFGGSSSDGTSPFGALTVGKDGNFYGTTTSGGTANSGIAFMLTTGGVETVLHNFGDSGVSNEGTQPRGALIQASDGNFYGMTPYGGATGQGTIFQMTKAGGVAILHSFGDGSITTDGANPFSGLIQGPDGNLYGLTQMGGLSNYGTFFKISLTGTMTMLHRFGEGTPAYDAVRPYDALILGADGNFYGTSYEGGNPGYGSIFEATPQGAIAILHSFTGPPALDGANPVGGLVMGSNGNFYGGAPYGGSVGDGILFELSMLSSPLITSATRTTFIANRAGSFTVTATGNPAPTFSATGLPVWATLNPTTGVLSTTAADPTDAPFTLTLTATNGTSPDATQTFTLNVQVPVVVPFSNWENSFANPLTGSSAQPLATPQNDGVSNLMKYVFDIDPTVPMDTAARSALPQVGVDPATGYLAITYREYEWIDLGVSVTAQTSTDLLNWTPIASQQVGIDPTTGDPMMRAEVPISGAKQFIRLNISGP